MLSTGVIGPRLPMEKLLAGVDAAAAALSPGGGPPAAEAILTTDAGPKTAVVERDGFTVGGMAKGAGMIHPCLATMLAVVTTDYPLAPGEADAFLRPGGRARSFNRISVDGDCSTNDAVVLLAHERRRPVATRSRDDAVRRGALSEVCADLARQIVADGEGATVVLEIVVVARRLARTRRARSRAASRRRRSSRRPPSVATRTGAGCSPRPARRRGTAASRGSTPTG